MYNRSMKHSFFPLVAFLFFVCSVRAVSAHGSGPPFLKVNGMYAQSNPYYQGGAVSLPVAQDLPPAKYIVNEPIHFEIDKSQLLFTPDIIDDITFRWSFNDKEKQYMYGDTISYTYKKIGSYLVHIEAQMPGESYILIDTVQINVLPTKAYVLPTSSITVGSNLKSADPLVVVSKQTADTAASITGSAWDLGEGTNKLRTGSTVCFSIGSNYFTEVYHRVTDSNGFYEDSGFSITSIDGKLQVNPAGYGVRPPLVKKFDELVSFKDRLFGPCADTSFLLRGIGSIIGVGVVGSLVFVFLSKRKRSDINRTAS